MFIILFFINLVSVKIGWLIETLDIIKTYFGIGSI